MLYSKQITVTKGTTESTAAKTNFQINRGVITSIWITFPPGCLGLTKLRIYVKGHPFVPVNKDNYIRGDSFTFVFPVMFEVTDAPELITVEAWNEDSTYNHTIDIIFLVLPKELVMPVGATEGILESLKNLVLRPIIMTELSTEGQ